MGVQYKLASAKGTLLGTITVPRRWAEMLDNGRHAVQFALCPKVSLEPFDPSELVTVQHGTLVRSYAIRGAVELWGISLEQFEEMDGCSFSPGAAYLRSIIQ